MNKITKPSISLLIALLMSGIATPIYSGVYGHFGKWMYDECVDTEQWECFSVGIDDVIDIDVNLTGE